MAGFIDGADWESVKAGGDTAVKKWVDEQLVGTSVTAVLIGVETSQREWVRYELRQSYARGNGILGIYLNNIPDWQGGREAPGDNMFGELGTDAAGQSVYLWQNYRIYDWESDNGFNNLGAWVEAAAKQAGR